MIILPSSLGFNKPHAPAVATDPHFANVVSLLHFNGNLTDQKGKIWSAAGGATTDATPMFGSGALNCSGGGYISTGSSLNDFNFGTGDFTVECFVYKANSGACLLIDARNANSGQPWVFYINSAEKLELYDGVQAHTAVTALPQSEYKHIAMTRQSGTLRMFMHGVMDYEFGSHTTSMGATAMYVGGVYQGLIERLDEFRVTKGVARYTADFTPPTEAFPDS